LYRSVKENHENRWALQARDWNFESINVRETIIQVSKKVNAVGSVDTFGDQLL
jgi:hypothetical protein